jgi:hypothetical protein
MNVHEIDARFMRLLSMILRFGGFYLVWRDYLLIMVDL